MTQALWLLLVVELSYSLKLVAIHPPQPPTRWDFSMLHQTGGRTEILKDRVLKKERAFPVVGKCGTNASEVQWTGQSRGEKPRRG